MSVDMLGGVSARGDVQPVVISDTGMIQHEMRQHLRPCKDEEGFACLYHGRVMIPHSDHLEDHGWVEDALGTLRQVPMRFIRFTDKG